MALHSTDPVTVYLSAMARMVQPSVEAVSAALYERRSLIRHHAMRRTLWVATVEVVRLMHAAATRALVAPERRRTCALLAAAGVDAPEVWLESALARTLAAFAEHGPMTARELGERVPELRHPLSLSPGKPYAATQSAHTRLLLILAFDGRLLRARPSGTWVSAAYRYVETEDWLPGGLGDLELRPAAAALAERWLRRFGPATTTDLRWWMGWTASLAKQALADLGAIAVSTPAGPAWVVADDEPCPVRSTPWVAVLPGLDPTIMGWKERAWYLPAAAADAFDSGGQRGSDTLGRRPGGGGLGADPGRGDRRPLLRAGRGRPAARAGRAARGAAVVGGADAVHPPVPLPDPRPAARRGRASAADLPDEAGNS